MHRRQGRLLKNTVVNTDAELSDNSYFQDSNVTVLHIDSERKTAPPLHKRKSVRKEKITANYAVHERPASKRTKRFSRFIPLFVCLLMIAATLSVTLALGTSRRNEQLKEEHLRALDSLASSRARLESVIYARFLLVSYNFV